MDSASAPYWIYIPDYTARVRVKRVLCASMDMSKPYMVESLDQLLDMQHTKGLICHDSGLDMILHLAATGLDMKYAVVSNDRYEAALAVLSECNDIDHLIGWPDFLTSPRTWDLMCVAQCFLKRDALHWTMFLSGCRSSYRWGLYSSFDRDIVVEQIDHLVRTQLQEERLADTVAEVAYEMIMNAMYDAPVDEFGRSKYSHDRQADIALDTEETPYIEFVTDGTMIALQVDDPFGRLKRYDVLEGIGRGLNAKNASVVKDVLNTKHGGAGLGLFRMFQLSSTLIFDVLKSQQTRVIALFDVGMRLKDRRNDLTSLHMSFR